MNPRRESIEKLMKAGYRIIRSADGEANEGTQPRIKVLVEAHGTYKTLSKHPSKAARDREMLRLVLEDNCLCID